MSRTFEKGIGVAQLLQYVDASDSTDLRVDFPEVVDELEGLGFAPVGRVLLDVGLFEAKKIADDYLPEDHDAFLAHWDVPMPVLASPDGTAFADVSWWWGGPSVRIRTELTDGSMAETRRTWDNKPALPRLLRFLWRRYDIEREMMRASVPPRGRSTRIRSGPDVAALWEAHEEHVADYGRSRGATPVRHEALETYLRIATQAVGHDEKVMRTLAKVWVRLAVTWGVVGAAVAVLGLIGGTLITLLLTLAATAVLMYLIPSRLRWLHESWRPAYPVEKW